MEHARLAEVVRDRDDRWGVDDRQARRRLPHLADEDPHPLPILVAFRPGGKRSAAASAARSPASSSPSRRRRLARGIADIRENDVESDFLRSLAERLIQ